MNKEILDAWLHSLRYGTTDNCQGRLRIGDYRSAHGVLADILVRSGWGYWKFSEKGWSWQYRAQQREAVESYFVSPPLREWWWPRWTPLCNERLHALNDRYGKKPKEIADLLEYGEDEPWSNLL